MDARVIGEEVDREGVGDRIDKIRARLAALPSAPWRPDPNDCTKLRDSAGDTLLRVVPEHGSVDEWSERDQATMEAIAALPDDVPWLIRALEHAISSAGGSRAPSSLDTPGILGIIGIVDDQEEE